jgi:hypothetical protein
MRLEPGTGMAVWLREHLDHQLSVLLGRSGPFAQCSEDEHIEPREARTEDAPPGWWEIGNDQDAPPPLDRGRR